MGTFASGCGDCNLLARPEQRVIDDGFMDLGLKLFEETLLAYVRTSFGPFYDCLARLTPTTDHHLGRNGTCSTLANPTTS